MKVVVVLSYFERPYQLNETLRSMTSTKHKDFEVVIVTDTSQKDFRVPDPGYKTTIIKYVKGRGAWIGGMIAFNNGFLYAMKAKADIVVIQNAECYHVGDVITKASTVVDGQYISFGCYSITEEVTFKSHDIGQIIQSNNIGATRDGENAWYNHPVFRPTGYHFCSAITLRDLKKLNGFDERFMYGVAYDDCDFLNRIKLLKLRIEITKTPFVVHQWHESGHGLLLNKGELMSRNKELFFALRREANPRAGHIMTKDL